MYDLGIYCLEMFLVYMATPFLRFAVSIGFARF